MMAECLVTEVIESPQRASRSPAFRTGGAGSAAAFKVVIERIPRTRQSVRIGIGRPQAVIGRSTVPAMQSGIFWGYVGLIEGLVARDDFSEARSLAALYMVRERQRAKGVKL